MKTIFLRDFKAAWLTPRGYVFSGAVLLTLNLYFYFANIRYPSSDLSPIFAFMLTVLMAGAPLLSMGVIAGESARGTLPLLRSMPVSPLAVISGKFFALWALFGTVLLGTLPWVMIIGRYGQLNAGAVWGHYLAISVFSAVLMALGILISCLTASQLSSAIGALGILLIWFLLDTAAASFSFLAWWQDFSLFGRYDTFAGGIFALGDIWFCAAITLLLLTAAAFRLSVRKPGRGVRMIRAAALILLLGAGWGGAKLMDHAYLRWDMTAGRVYALSEATIQTLTTLKEPITITALAAETEWQGNASDPVTGATYHLTMTRELLTKLQAIAPEALTVRYLEPELNPEFLRTRDPEGKLAEFDLIVESGRRMLSIPLSNLFDAQVVADETGYPMYAQTTAFRAEEALVGALLYVTAERLTGAVVLTGHDEATLPGFYDLLAYAGYEIQEVNLLREELPEGTRLTIIAAPLADYTQDEIDKLEAFLDEGGQVLGFSDPSSPEMPRLAAFWADWGLQEHPLYIMDAEMNFGRSDFILPVIEEDVLTEALSRTKDRYICLPGSRALSLLWDVNANRMTTALFSTYDTAFGKKITEDEPIRGLDQNPEDTTGPFILGAISVEYRDDQPYTSVALLPLGLTATEILSEDIFLNKTFLLSYLGEAAGNARVAPVIASRPLSAGPMTLTAEQGRVIFGLLCVLTPLCLFGAGIAVWFGRRRR